MTILESGVAPEWARPTLFFGGQALKADATESIRAVARRVTDSRGFELVDVEWKRGPSGETLVQVFVDKEGGIGLDDLQSVSEEVSAILDVEDPIASQYTLEVSSPGLDRPLRGLEDYRRFIGRLVKLKAFGPVDGRKQWVGRLVSVEDETVVVGLEKEDGILARVPLSKISQGRLEVEFPGASTDGTAGRRRHNGK